MDTAHNIIPQTSTNIHTILDTSKTVLMSGRMNFIPYTNTRGNRVFEIIIHSGHVIVCTANYWITGGWIFLQVLIRYGSRIPHPRHTFLCMSVCFEQLKLQVFVVFFILTVFLNKHSTACSTHNKEVKQSTKEKSTHYLNKGNFSAVTPQQMTARLAFQVKRQWKSHLRRHQIDRSSTDYDPDGMTWEMTVSDLEPDLV